MYLFLSFSFFILSISSRVHLPPFSNEEEPLLRRESFSLSRLQSYYIIRYYKYTRTRRRRTRRKRRRYDDEKAARVSLRARSTFFKLFSHVSSEGEKNTRRRRRPRRRRRTRRRGLEEEQEDEEENARIFNRPWHSGNRERSLSRRPRVRGRRHAKGRVGRDRGTGVDGRDARRGGVRHRVRANRSREDVRFVEYSGNDIVDGRRLGEGFYVQEKRGRRRGRRG